MGMRNINIIENPTSHEVFISFLMIKAKIIIPCNVVLKVCGVNT